MLEKRSVSNPKRSTRGSYTKIAQQNEKHGRASNRTGIAYASREAGRSDAHFEVSNRARPKGATATRRKSKHPRRKTNEQRITSG
ncbi:MAG TPA: hypothetical protein VEJ63_01200 [Planctomycetota bacterium]|nr:hypothetical protein [Planctomycetota bacterium]